MSDAVHWVVVRCPSTGAAVNTVLRLKPAAFEALTGERSFRCERCGEIHVWSRENAWLESAGRRTRLNA